ncbi:MAG: hypothetical protein AB1394_05830 [Bacteroidota bacterium]
MISSNLKIISLFIFAILFFSSCKEEYPTEAVPDYSGKWEGLASDGGQLGTGGLSVFTLNLSQAGKNISGSVTIRKAVSADSYSGTITGKIVSSGGLYGLESNFVLLINSCNVSVTLTAVKNYGRLVGSFNGTNDCKGKITGGTLVLDKK